MANPKLIIKLALGPHKESSKEEVGEEAIVELIERVFTTRSLVHFAHWNTDSYARHMALGELYESIVEDTDEIVETYQGEFGLISGLETCEAKLDRDILDIIKDDANWLKTNRLKIAKKSTVIENLLDTLAGSYNKVIYKLTNLK